MALNDNALTDLATVKSRLGIADASEDTLIEALINAASDAFIAELGRPITRATVTGEGVRGYGTRLLRLERRPVASVAAVAYDGHAIAPGEYHIDDAEAGTLALDSPATWLDTGFASGGLSGGKRAGTQRPDYTVTYDGGYVTPKLAADGVGTRDLPHGIEEAVLAMCEMLYEEPPAHIASESIDDASVKYREVGATRPRLWGLMLSAHTAADQVVG